MKIHPVVKIGVSCSLILILIWLAGSGELSFHLSSFSVADVALICLFTLISLALLARRFQRVLLFRGVNKTWRELFSLQLMGLAFNQFLPGIYGGDILRAVFYMPGHNDLKKFFFAAVLFERLCGLLAMTSLGLAGSIYIAIFLQQPVWLGLASGLTGGIIVLFLMGRAVAAGRADRLLRWRWLRLSLDITSELQRLFGEKRVVITTVGLSAVSQCCSVITYCYLARVLEVSLAFPAVAAVAALGWLATLLPLSLNGLGLREGGLVFGFLSLGLARSEAVTISLVALLPTLFYALLGAVLVACNMERIVRLREIVSLQAATDSHS